MDAWEDYFSTLRCIECRQPLDLVHDSEAFSYCPSVNRMLVCSCGRKYPLFQDIPIMFKDEDRTRLLLDSSEYDAKLQEAQTKMQEASQLTGKELLDLKQEGNLADALTWEILFWEKWSQYGKGFAEWTRERREEYLKVHDEGGGKAEFIRRTLALGGRGRLLNIGAGPDWIMECFLEEGLEVVEQDIVLKSLLLLKSRGASFCVCCDGRTLPFADDTFDVSTAFGVLHHIWPLDEPLSELLRVTSGIIHCNEPNSLALTSAGLYLPGPLKRKLKNWYSGDYSHSPYEKSINPYAFKKIVKGCGGKIVDMHFPRSSWISGKSIGFKKWIRKLNLLLLHILPFISSHFDIVIRKA